MASKWIFPIVDADHQLVNNWRETTVNTAMMESKRGKYSEGNRRTDPTTGVAVPCSRGWTISYYFTPDEPLSLTISDSRRISGTVVVKCHTTHLQLQLRSPTDGYCCCSGKDNASYQVTVEEMMKIQEWLQSREPQMDISTASVTYVFCDTAIGTVTKILLPTGETFDFTDYDTW